MEVDTPTPFRVMNSNEIVAFQSYFLVLFVVSCVAIAYLAYKLGWFLVNIKHTFVCEEFCTRG